MPTKHIEAVKLKPCPFCGGKAKLSVGLAPSYGGVGADAHISCESRQCLVRPQTGSRVYAPNTKRLVRVDATHKTWIENFEKRKVEYPKASRAAVAAAAKRWNRRLLKQRKTK